MTSEDLTWSEVGDALWLAAATRHAWCAVPPEAPQGSAAEPSAGEDPESVPPDAAPRDDAPPPESGWEETGAEQDAEQPTAGVAADGVGDLTSGTTSVGSHAEPEGVWSEAWPAAPGRPEAVRVPRLGTSAVVRALRPLKRQVPSWRDEDDVLDEEATAERAAEDRLWLPVTTPGRTRWLDLTVVVDTGPSIELWRPVVTAFISLLEGLGVFRTIHSRLLDVRETADGPQPVLRGGTRLAATRGAAEVLDPSGRRLVLAVTDGFTPAWRDGALHSALALWGRSMPVALLHLLPQHLWNREGPAFHRARLTTPGPLAPNEQWAVELSDAWLIPDSAATEHGATEHGATEHAVPVPVLRLDERWLGWWARLITTGPHEPADATVLLAHDRYHSDTRHEAPPDSGQPADIPLSGVERVREFRSSATPTAFRLASLLAAVPVSLDIAHLVQAEFVPDSEPSHLAEILVSGLLHPSEPSRADGTRGLDGDALIFEFPDEVRAALLQGAQRSQTVQVVRTVAALLPDRTGALTRLKNALDAPDTTPDPEITPNAMAYVAVERAVMRALSGPYLSRARRLGLSLARGPTVGVTQPPTNTTLSEMEDTLSSTTPGGAAQTDRASVTGGSLPPASEAPALQVVPTRDSGSRVSPAMPGVSDSLARVIPRERTAEDVPPIWGNIPPRNPNFTGRRELLEQLRERLAAGGTTAVLPAALHGMGGIGKTQMAVEYIYRHLRDYDIIWWIQANQAAQIRASLTELAQHLGLPGSAEANTAVPVVREALRVGEPFRRWLLIFDSAESPEAVRPFFPTNGPGEILITSRNPDWAGIARPLGVDLFKREESKELLKRRGPEIDDEEADALGERLGDLPLAIEQAATWRAETGMPVNEYLRLFDEKVAEILDTSAPADYEVSVAAAWNVSFDELEKRNPAAHQLLQVCAFFSPEPIARGLFSGVREISIAPELDAALRDPIKLGRAIRDINRYGLAKIDYRNDTLQLHRLVQLVLTNRMTPQLRKKMRHGAHLLLANLDPRDPVKASQWHRYQEILPHAYAADVVECQDRWVGQMVLNLTTFLYYWGDHEEAARLSRMALEEWSRGLGEDDGQTLRAARNLGFYLSILGRYTEASEVNLRTLEGYRRVAGDESEEALSAQGAVALDLQAQGSFAAARDLREEVHFKTKALFGPDDPTTLGTAQNFAVALRLTGEYTRARELDEDSYRRRMVLFGYDNMDTISNLNGLILDRREAGEYVWARAELEKLAEQVRQLFGDDKAFTLRRMLHLAVARRKDGDHRGALELSRASLERFRFRYGDDHPNTMGCALALSIDLRHAGDLAASRRLGEQTFDRYRANLGENHPHTLSAAADLAVTLRHLGDAVGARQIDERSLEQLRASVGADHPAAITVAINLASDLATQGDHEAALEMDTDAWERSQRVFGDRHPTTLAASINLSLDLRALGRVQDAETRFAEAVTLYRQVLGDSHPATVAAGSGTRADCDIDPMPM